MFVCLFYVKKMLKCKKVGGGGWKFAVINTQKGKFSWKKKEEKVIKGSAGRFVGRKISDFPAVEIAHNFPHLIKWKET